MHGPCVYQWVPGSNHTVSAATQSGGSGIQYAFTSWSDGGGASHTVAGPGSPATYTANFVTQYWLTTSAGSGGAIAPASGWQNAGTVVSVSATPSAGYQFSGFSGALGGTTTPQNLTMNGQASVTASFSLLPVTVTVASSPAGRSLTVDGAGCVAPCAFQWMPGSSHAIAGGTEAGGAGTQYVFANWSDGGAASHSITTPSSSTTYTASFTTQYYLTTSAGAGGSIAPASGWYNSGAAVSVSATPSAGNSFAGFSGSLTGTTTPQNLIIAGPANVMASFTAPVTVTSAPAGLSLTVDGAACAAPCVRLWLPGSSHTIAAATQAGAAGTQYAFASWSDGGGASHSVTAQSSPATYTANFTTQYYLTTIGGTGGTISPASGWHNAVAVVSVNATATAGYEFSHFSGGLTGSITPQNVTLNGPLTVTANFAPSVPVTLATSPAGLALMVDGATCAAPCSRSWIPGSSHTIAATTQGGTETQYLFANWSDGGAASHAVTGPASTSTFTATFTSQYYLTTSPTPAAGGSITPTSGWFNSGSTVSVAATANPGYQFSAFSGGLTGSGTPQSLTISAPMAVTAAFIGLPVTHSVTTVPPGLTLTVDGASCLTPCSAQWTTGSSHTIVAAETVTGAPGTRYVLSAWSDGGVASHAVTAPPTAVSYIASYTTQYELRTAADAVSGGTITPATAWHNAGGVVSVAAAPATGYRFNGFSGALSGTTTPQNLTMNGPASVTAEFVAVPSLSVTVTHAGNFAQSATESYTIVVSNGASAGPTSGIVTVMETVPSGLALQSMNGNGWTCNANACTRDDVLVPGGSYPQIVATVAVAANALSPVVNAVTVSGGASPSASATDTTIVGPPRDFTLTVTPIKSATLQGFSADVLSYRVDVTALNGFNSDVSFAVAGFPPGASISFSPATVRGTGSTTLTVTIGVHDKGGDYPLTITGKGGGVTKSVTALLQIQDYSITMTPAVRVLPCNGTATYEIQITGLGGYTGQVNLRVQVTDPYATAAVSTPIAFPGDNVTVTVNTFHPPQLCFRQEASVLIRSWITRSVYTIERLLNNLAVIDPANAADFSLTAPATVSGTVSNSVMFPVTVSSANGFSNTVTLTAAYVPSGVTVSFSPSTLPGSGVSNVTLTFAGTVSQTSQFAIRGTSGVTNHLFEGKLIIQAAPDFTVSVSPPSVTAMQGTSANYTVSVSGSAGFNGPVTLSAGASWPAGVSATFSPNPVTGTGISTVSIQVAANAPVGGPYALPINAQSGSLMRSITPTLTIIAPPAGQHYLTTVPSPPEGGSITPTSGLQTADQAVTISATANPGYRFTGFSGDLSGTASPQSLLMTKPMNVTASFAPLPGSVTITTNPEGRQIVVDGVAFPAPQTFTWSVGTSHVISVVSPQTDGSGVQYGFLNWLDGGALERSITVGATPVTYTANLSAVATYTISGTVRLGTTPLAGVNVALSGGQTASATTDASGNFSFAGLPGGASYTITPNTGGRTFCPGSKTFTALAANQSYTFSADAPAREYIRLGGRVIAIEGCGTP